MNGKIVLITGATSGIGKQTALELARMGARVVLVARDPARGQATLEEIHRQTGNSNLDLLLADLSAQATEVSTRLQRLARYMTYKQLPPPLRARVLAYYAFQVTTPDPGLRPSPPPSP